MNPLQRLAEARIQAALESGALAENPLKGRRLELEDLTGVPEDLRAGYTLLAGAGVLPQEMELKKHILSLGDLLTACHDEHRAESIRRELRSSFLRYQVLMERRGIGSAHSDYHEAILGKLG
jgi:hypothetical protein